MTNPNYKKAETLAYKILSTFPKPSIPVDVFSIAAYFSNLRIKPYSWFAKLHNITIADVEIFAQSESGCCYYSKAQNNYLILYNDAIPSAGHVRWTLGHELGHFLLKHNELSEEAVVSRNSLSSSQYDIYEKEANCFARSLLAPPSLLVALDITQYTDIVDAFSLSPSAAKNVVSFVKSSNSMGIFYSKDCSLTKNFTNVITRFLQLKRCKCCNVEYSRHFNYCPICGASERHNAGAGCMEYPGIKLDEHGRTKICPICKNEEYPEGAEYCMICGKPAINQCTYAIKDSDYGDYVDQCQHQEPLPGNARYCPYCGNKTTFFENKLLTEWNSQINYIDLLALPVEDENGELPF